MVPCFPKKLVFFSKALPKPEEAQGFIQAHKVIIYQWNTSSGISCICHLFLNLLKNRSFKLGYYLFFV